MTFGSGNTVHVTIKGDASHLKREMAQARGETTKGADAITDKMRSIGTVAKVAIAGVAAKAITDFAGDSVRAYSDLNESLNAVNVSYGTNAEGIKKLGEEAAQSLGLSNAEFNGFAVRMSAFAKQIAGDGGDVVGVVDDMSNRVADFASVMNLEVADAAQVFQSGLAGESEPLRKYGVDVSAATVATYAYANGIAAAGEKLTEQQKVMARYGTIMEQTSQVQGDFANTATDYANAQRIANAEMENAKARAGEALVPVAQLFEQFKLAGAKTLGVLATGFQQLTGKISPTDAAIQEFQIHMGQSADSAAAALTIMKEYGESASDLIPRMGLAADEIMVLRDASDELLLSMGFTEDQIDDLRDAVDKELSKAMSAGADEVLKMKGAQDDLEESTVDATDAIRKEFDAIRALTDPVFGAVDAVGALEESQRELEEAQNDGVTSADELARMELEVAEKAIKASGALAELGSGDINAGIDTIARTLGKSKDEVILLLNQLGILDGYDVDADVTLNYHSRGLSAVQRAVADATGVRFSGASFAGIRHTGGEINLPRGQEGYAKVMGGERIVNDDVRGSGGGGNTINAFVLSWGDFVEKMRDAGVEVDRLGW